MLSVGESRDFAAVGTVAKKEVKLTRNQQKVYSKLACIGRSVGAYELLEQLRSEGVNAIPTVYRALNELEEKGLVRHLRSTKTFMVLSPRVDNNRNTVMLICNKCKAVSQMEGGALLNELLENAQRKGFSVQHQHLELIGTCLKCHNGKECNNESMS